MVREGSSGLVGHLGHTEVREQDLGQRTQHVQGAWGGKTSLAGAQRMRRRSGWEGQGQGKCWGVVEGVPPRTGRAD